MTPAELVTAAREIGERWSDALIYPNPPPADNGWVRNPGVPDNALAVDVDRVWPHVCEGEDCNECCGWYQLVAWIDVMGVVHYTELAAVDAEDDSRDRYSHDELLELLSAMSLSVMDRDPPIFYREATWYDRGGWVWNYTTGDPQGYVDFSDKRWLHLLDGWVIEGKAVRYVKADEPVGVSDNDRKLKP